MDEGEGREDGSTELVDDWTVDEDVDGSTGVEELTGNEDEGSTFDEEDSSWAKPRQAIASKAATRTTDVRILMQTKKNQSLKKKTHTRKKRVLGGVLASNGLVWQLHCSFFSFLLCCKQWARLKGT